MSSYLTKKPEAPQYRFDISKKKGVSIKSFCIKETNGDDEDLASDMKLAAGSKATVFSELVRVSITYVNDVKVEQPFAEFDSWNSKTRAYVLAAFRSINSIDDKEVDTFLEAGAPYAAGTKGESDAGASGSNG